MPATSNWSQFLLTGSNRCHGPIAKTSYGGHSRVEAQHWSTWWMSDQNESSHAFTSFEFMHGEACQGREMMWTLALAVCQDFTSLPLVSRLNQVICCGAACRQYASESRLNIFTGMTAIRLFCGCKSSLCIQHAIYHFNGPQLSHWTCLNLVTALVYFIFYVYNSDSKSLDVFSSLDSWGPKRNLKSRRTNNRLYKVEHLIKVRHQMV